MSRVVSRVYISIFVYVSRVYVSIFFFAPGLRRHKSMFANTTHRFVSRVYIYIFFFLEMLDSKKMCDSFEG